MPGWLSLCSPGVCLQTLEDGSSRWPSCPSRATAPGTLATSLGPWLSVKVEEQAERLLFHHYWGHSRKPRTAWEPDAQVTFNRSWWRLRADLDSH